MEKMKEIEKIYLIQVLNIKKKTEKDFEKDFKIFKEKYDWYKGKTVEEFKEYIKNDDVYRMFRLSDYNITEAEDIGFFTNEETAKECVINNYADINECGSYPYAVIIPIKANTLYPECYAIENKEYDVMVFEFDDKNDKYIQLNEKDFSTDLDNYNKEDEENEKNKEKIEKIKEVKEIFRYYKL